MRCSTGHVHDAHYTTHRDTDKNPLEGGYLPVDRGVNNQSQRPKPAQTKARSRANQAVAKTGVRKRVQTSLPHRNHVTSGKTDMTDAGRSRGQVRRPRVNPRSSRISPRCSKASWDSLVKLRFPVPCLCGEEQPSLIFLRRCRLRRAARVVVDSAYPSGTDINSFCPGEGAIRPRD
mgnify:CR=1 FL=1